MRGLAVVTPEDLLSTLRMPSFLLTKSSAPTPPKCYLEAGLIFFVARTTRECSSEDLCGPQYWKQ